MRNPVNKSRPEFVYISSRFKMGKLLGLPWNSICIHPDVLLKDHLSELHYKVFIKRG